MHFRVSAIYGCPANWLYQPWRGRRISPIPQRDSAASVTKGRSCPRRDSTKSSQGVPKKSPTSPNSINFSTRLRLRPPRRHAPVAGKRAAQVGQVSHQCCMRHRRRRARELRCRHRQLPVHKAFCFHSCLAPRVSFFFLVGGLRLHELQTPQFCCKSILLPLGPRDADVVLLRFRGTKTA